MSVAILIPWMRRHRLTTLLESIHAATPEPHGVYLLGGDNSWPRKINRGYRQSHEPYLFLGADDLLFHPGWLTAAMREMQRVDGVVVVNDLHNPNGTAALVSRAYVDEFGTIDGRGVVHEGYHHNYVDNECWETAQYRGRYAYCADAVVEHLHPDAGKAEDDAVYRLGLSLLEQDRALYESRQRLWA